MYKYFIPILILFFNNIGQAQIRIEDGVYLTPVILNKQSKYIFKADTFEAYDCSNNFAIKGLYKIVANKINFYPFDPALLKKSVVKYRNESSDLNMNDFWFFVNCKDSKHKKLAFGVWFFPDSSDRSILTLTSNGDSLQVYCPYLKHIRRVMVSGVGINDKHEEIDLKYDKELMGSHYFTIELAEVDKQYIARKYFSVELLNISEMGFTTIDSGDTLELRKEKYIDSVFIWSWWKKKEQHTYYDLIVF